MNTGIQRVISAHPSAPIVSVETALPTISEAVWAKAEPLIRALERPVGREYRRAPGGGRKPSDPRKTLAAILFVLRNGFAWRAMPKELGSVPTIHRYFKRWRQAGVFAELRRTRPDAPELQNIDWVPYETVVQEGPALPREKAPLPEQCECSDGGPKLTDPAIQSRLLRLQRATNTTEFWSAAQALFREAIPTNSIVSYLDYLNHPKTWKAAKILATTNASMPPEWYEQRWKLDITPAFLHTHPGIKFFRFSDIISDAREFRNTDYFKQFFKPFGWQYTACLSYWRGKELSSVIALRRTQEQGDFRPGEIDLFKKLHPHIETVLDRLMASHNAQCKGDWLGDLTQHIPMSILLLSWNLEPVYVNREALAQCARWNFGPKQVAAYDARQIFRIPADILRQCERLKSQWSEVPAESQKAQSRPSGLIVHQKIPGFTATVTVHPGDSSLITKPGFMVYFERPADENEPAQDQGDSRLLWRLTEPEREVLRLASAGATNGEIARHLHKSVNTVKHQLSTIYGKLGMGGRRNRYGSRLLAPILGNVPIS